MREPLYKLGDKVRVVKFGHLVWENKNMPNQMTKLPTYSEDENTRWVDITPNAVGKEGVVSVVGNAQGVPSYSIKGIPEKASWYSEQQLELIK